mgnify:CR=1 FL=1|jgi:hypothetical protein
MATAQSLVRDIKLFGSLAIVFGSLMMFASLGGGFIYLASNAYLTTDPWQAWLTVTAALITGWTMVGIGNEFARATESSIKHHEGLRLDWTALLVVLAITMVLSAWTFQPLAFLCALWILGLFWVRISILQLINLH